MTEIPAFFLVTRHGHTGEFLTGFGVDGKPRWGERHVKEFAWHNEARVAADRARRTSYPGTNVSVVTVPVLEDES